MSDHETTDDQSTTQAARATASTAVDEGRHLASTATDQAREVAGEAAQQARNVAREAHQQVTSTLEEQGRVQRDRLTETLHTVGGDLEQMSQQSSGLAGQLAGEAAQRARAAGSYLGSREPGQLLDDARRFARDRPGTFLLGALAAGVVVGRLTRGVAEGIDAATADSAETSTSQPAAPVPGPAASLPPAQDAPHGTPTMPPPSLPTEAPVIPPTATPTPGEPLPGGGLR